MLTALFFYRGRTYEVMLEERGPFAGMVHLRDAEKLHDPLNGDIVITGARWAPTAAGGGSEVILGDATLQGVTQEEAARLVPIMTEALRRKLAA